MARILIIDDDDQILDILRQLLEHAGYEVVDAPDGKVAMSGFCEKPVALVIRDILMPERMAYRSLWNCDVISQM